MAEETKFKANEPTPPSKEQMIEFLQEQIEVKTLQKQLQELNTAIAQMKAEEIKSFAFIASMQQQQPEAVDHQVTQEDMDNNPELAEAGINVGDTIQIPAEPRKLKKS